MSLILINQAPGHPKMRFSRSRPTELPFIHPPPPTVRKMCFFHLVSPAGHFRYPPHYFGGAEFNYEPNSHQPSAGTSQNLFFRVQTDTISVYPPPPPPQRCRKWVFSPREPGRALQVPIPLTLGVLNSIMSLILINQALGHPKIRFSGPDQQNFRLSTTPPKTVPKIGFFTS